MEKILQTAEEAHKDDSLIAEHELKKIQETMRRAMATGGDKVRVSARAFFFCDGGSGSGDAVSAAALNFPASIESTSAHTLFSLSSLMLPVL